MSSRFKFACSFCETSYESEAILRVHEEAEHAGEMFRCLACTQTVSLFPSYGLASQHSRLVHEVSVEAAAQFSILLPSILVRYRWVSFSSLSPPSHQSLTFPAASSVVTRPNRT